MKKVSSSMLSLIESDLKNMIACIPPVKGQAGNINFPLALYTLSAMDFLGSVINKNKGGGKENFRKYINNYFPEGKKYSANILWELFRNGLSHQFFAKNASVSRSINTLEYALYRYTESEKIILDSDTLARHFIESFKKLKNDTSFNNLLEERIRAIRDEIQKIFRKDKQLIKDFKELPLLKIDLMSYGISGASGYPESITFTPSQHELSDGIEKEAPIRRAYPPVKITLDTNILFDLLGKQRSHNTDAIEVFNNKNLKLFITETVLKEIQDDNQKKQVNKLIDDNKTIGILDEPRMGALIPAQIPMDFSHISPMRDKLLEDDVNKRRISKSKIIRDGLIAEAHKRNENLFLLTRDTDFSAHYDISCGNYEDLKEFLKTIHDRQK